MCCIDGYAIEQRYVLAAMGESSEVCSSRVGEKDERQRRYMSSHSMLVTAPHKRTLQAMSLAWKECVEFCLSVHPLQFRAAVQELVGAISSGQSNLSSSFRFSTSNFSSQPTSTSILMPPSSSRRDCDAGDAESAPSSGVKLNIGARVAHQSKNVVRILDTIEYVSCASCRRDRSVRL